MEKNSEFGGPNKNDETSGFGGPNKDETNKSIRKIMDDNYHKEIKNADARSKEFGSLGRRALILDMTGVKPMSDDERMDYGFVEFLDRATDDVEDIAFSGNTTDGEGETDNDVVDSEIVKRAEAARSAIYGEVRETVREQKKLTALRVGSAIELKFKKRILARENPYDPQNQETIEIQEKIDNYSNESTKLSNRDQGTFLASKMLECQRLLVEKRNGGIMTTPYVARKKEAIRDSIDFGVPVFIHGHLGSGKTELAIAVAKESAIDREAERYAIEECVRYSKEQFLNYKTTLTHDEKVRKLGEFYLERKAHLEAVVSGIRQPNDDEKDVSERCSPLIISGSRDIETRDLLADKKLSVVAPFAGKEVSEVVRMYDEGYQAAAAENANREGYKNLSDEERKRKEEEFTRTYSEAFFAKHNKAGTEIETIANAVLQGIREGRPVIIDEANSIPTGVLLSLNNILNRRPGETCYVPGIGDAKIKEGFSIIMTGNFSTNDVEYGGTDTKLNPALESRLRMIEYSYLPQSEIGFLNERGENADKDELFQIALAYIANGRGSIEIAGGEHELKKLYALTQVARTTQMMFSGGHSNSKFYGESYAEMPKIQSPPISVRGLLKILSGWEAGKKCSLDEAFFREYISGIRNPEEQKLIFQCASTAGLFDSNEGWTLEEKISDDGLGKLVTDIDEIYDSTKKSMHNRNIEHYPMMNVIHYMYGDGPDASEYFKGIVDRVMGEFKGDKDNTMTDEEYVEKRLGVKRRYGEVGQAIEFLKIFGGQCGCKVEPWTAQN